MAKKYPNAFIWCSKAKHTTREGKFNVSSGLNCIIKVEHAKKCTWQGKPAKCVETANMYQISNGWNMPRWRNRK